MNWIKKLFSKKIIEKKCFIYGVGKWFYCYHHKDPHYNISCKIQCNECVLKQEAKQ